MCSDIIQIDGIDYRIEVAREGEACEQFQDLKDVRCDKNPGHGKFIPFHELNLNHLPPAYRTVDLLHEIKYKGKLVVRIVVQDDSGRPIGYGSGFVLKIYNKYVILTNNHVIKDGRDAKNSVIEFNFDSHTSEKIFCKGLDIFYTCPLRDITQFFFEPTEFLNTMDIVDVAIYIPTVEITFINGKILERSYLILIDNGMICTPIMLDPNHPEIKDISVRFTDGTVSKLISPYITFYPIPDNIQSFSHQMSGYHHPKVELVPHEGEYTIPLQGELIYSFNTITIKLSQSLTKQEAENCLIYFPDGRKSRGAGLYFDVDTNYVKSKVNQVDGIDRELYWKTYGTCHYSVMFKPIPVSISRGKKHDPRSPNESMIIIGHPHGAPKMVTFGKYLGFIFYNDADRKIQCIQYSCNTCPGSSGSPIFILDCIENMYSTIPHVMGRSVSDREIHTLGISNVNSAWGPV